MGVAEIAVDTAPGAARYSFGKCRVRMRIENKPEVMFVQLGSRQECDAFASCIGACAKHQKLALISTACPTDGKIATGAYSDVAENSLLSVPSTLLRMVSQLQG